MRLPADNFEKDARSFATRVVNCWRHCSAEYFVDINMGEQIGRIELFYGTGCKADELTTALRPVFAKHLRAFLLEAQAIIGDTSVVKENSEKTAQE